MQHAIPFAGCSAPRVGSDALRGDDTWMDFANLIRAEYSEMPGLSLNAAQVQRLWNLDPTSAKVLLTHLVDTGFLRCTARGTYLRER